MHVFISWSGKRSRTVATALRTWLRAPLSPEVETSLSSVDITTGEQWDTELRKALAESSFGIICLTEEALRSPWVVFEAGALGKISPVACVAPYLIGLSLHDKTFPNPSGGIRQPRPRGKAHGPWSNRSTSASRQHDAGARISGGASPERGRASSEFWMTFRHRSRGRICRPTSCSLFWRVAMPSEARKALCFRIILRRARQPRTAIDGTFVLSEFRSKADRDVTESELYYRLEQLRLLGLISKKPSLTPRSTDTT